MSERVPRVLWVDLCDPTSRNTLVEKRISCAFTTHLPTCFHRPAVDPPAIAAALGKVSAQLLNSPCHTTTYILWHSISNRNPK